MNMISEPFQRQETNTQSSIANAKLAIERSAGYCLYTVGEKRFIDLHLDGGTFNLGHSHPELVEVLSQATKRFDMGNHHFPSMARDALAQALTDITPGDLKYTVYASSDSEALEIAYKSARSVTEKTTIVTLCNPASVLQAEPATHTSDQLQESQFTTLAYNDSASLEQLFKQANVAAVVLDPCNLIGSKSTDIQKVLLLIKQLCSNYNVLLIVNEMRSGLMRSGKMWAIDHYGLIPDILLVGKGISGGLYPISCCIFTEKSSSWMTGCAVQHIATTGGAELGCIVALKVLEICQRGEVVSTVQYIANFYTVALHDLQNNFRQLLIEVRQQGVVIELVYPDSQSATLMFDNLITLGVLVLRSTTEPKVLQFNPGILMSQALCEEVLNRLHIASEHTAAKRSLSRTEAGK